MLSFDRSLLSTLEPLHSAIEQRKKADQSTPLDERISILYQKVYSVRHENSHSSTGSTRMRHHTEVSDLLTFADFQAALEFDRGLAQKIIDYLDLQPNINRINPHFSFEERIRAVSERVLSCLKVDHLQYNWPPSEEVHTAVWYALAPEQQFLNRQVPHLKNLQDVARVAAARLKDMEEKYPATSIALTHKTEIRVPSKKNELDLSINDLRTLSSNELNQLAALLPNTACALFSDSQIRLLNFALFTKGQLDDLIGGDGTDEEVQRRLALLTNHQRDIFELNTSGVHFHTYPDEFFETLSLKRFSFEQIKNMFRQYPRMKAARALRHFQLVPAEEISRHLHYFSDSCFALDSCFNLLSNKQIAALKYSALTQKEIKSLFFRPIKEDDKKNRISAIPPSAVNTVVKKYDKILKYLSLEQIPHIDPKLLRTHRIRALFAGFRLETLYPGYTYEIKNDSWGIRHHFTSDRKGGTFYYQDQLDALIAERKNRCIELAKVMTRQQLKKIKPALYPEVRELLADFY